MPENNEEKMPNIAEGTAIIAASFIARDETITEEDLPHLLKSIAQALHNSIISAQKKMPPAFPPVPAVDPRESVFKDYIICLEDGKKLKMLKRHLSSVYNMTPREYCEKWGLPLNYPMVAPNYRAERSQIAKNLGLGKTDEHAKNKTSKPEIEKPPAIPDIVESEPAGSKKTPAKTPPARKSTARTKATTQKKPRAVKKTQS